MSSAKSITAVRVNRSLDRNRVSYDYPSAMKKDDFPKNDRHPLILDERGIVVTPCLTYEYQPIRAIIRTIFNCFVREDSRDSIRESDVVHRFRLL